MIRYLFALVVFVHGCLHAMGFLKTFRLASIPQLTINIPKTEGITWLLTSLLFATTAILVLLQDVRWYMPAAIAVIISQVLIFMHWKSAKAGTVLNIIILIVVIQACSQWHFFESLFQVQAKHHTESYVPDKVNQRNK